MLTKNVDWRELVMLKAMRTLRTFRLQKLLRAQISTQSFADFFKDFEKLNAVREIFGDKTEQVLQNLKVEFTWVNGYMWINNTNGHLVISSRYLNEGNKTDIYLDLIHELVHIRQHLEGKELFDDNYNYVDRPTEIEAYEITVKEARNLGLSDERICEYLKTEWITTDELKRLAETLGVKNE
jgi:hypothetical protein